MAVQGTYQNDPANNDIDRVRFLAQDSESPYHLSDTEIEFLISEAGNGDAAAPMAAEMIAGKLAVMPDKRVGPVFLRHSTQSRNYFDLAIRLRVRLALTSSGGPILTQTNRPPLITIGMHDLYGQTDPNIWPGGVEPDPDPTDSPNFYNNPGGY
jgi:hypothetical protein